MLQWKCRDRVLTVADSPLIMGILNVTPDSFYDGGTSFDLRAAVARGLRLAEEGADIIDIGGESTRPGAAEVSCRQELERVVPVIRELAGRIDTALSVDTTKAEVARAALDAGARIINDVSAFEHDPGMADVAREASAGVVLMHMRGTPRTMQKEPHYEDVVEEVSAYLQARVAAAVAAGLAPETLVVDPGIGFGKTLEHNLRLLARLDRAGACGRPVLVGLSRKSFLGGLTGREAGERLGGSLAALTFCVLHGAHIMRVHDVKESCDAVRVATILDARRKSDNAVLA